MALSIVTGSSYPLGASVCDDGVNFALYSAEADAIELCLYDEQEQLQQRFMLPSRQGRIWYGKVLGARAGQLYAYRAYGPNQPELGLCFDAQKLLIDPYAKALNRVVRWDASAYQGDSAAMIPKSLVVDDEAFDWQGVVKPQLPLKATVLYETHVKGFSALNNQLPKEIRGTYLALCHPSAIAHFKKLSITALQIMPVAAFMSEPRLADLGLSNYWGYNPIAFMAPEPRYAQQPRQVVQEFKTMVRELHRHGIEVILDVVFNHTAEGGHGGPILSLKGLDNRNYYCFDQHGGQPNYLHYSNHTGCGNTVNLDYPWALRLTLDALRYWVTQMQVDGFRFDLAVTLARENQSFDPYGALFKALMQDPVLGRVKLIAEPWDIGPGGYRLGQFPSNWQECNDRYRDTMRAFWRGDTGTIGEFATRLLGSRDIFPKGYRSIHSSVNFICYHDGFTLHDTVCYNQRHNQANCEDNRDGHSHNLSANYGVEGPTRDVQILALRERQKRNLIATLFFSQGMVHFLSGDEMGRSQQGNNNAYCQNNAISWQNWRLNLQQQQLLEYTAYVAALRQRFSLLHNLQLEDDPYYGLQQQHKVRWYRPDGQLMQGGDWESPSTQALAIELLDGCGQRLYIIFNASSYDILFKLPAGHRGYWQPLLDTQQEDGKPHQLDGIAVPAVMVHSRSLMLWNWCDETA